LCGGESSFFPKDYLHFFSSKKFLETNDMRKRGFGIKKNWWYEERTCHGL